MTMPFTLYSKQKVQQLMVVGLFYYKIVVFYHKNEISSLNFEPRNKFSEFLGIVKYKYSYYSST